MGFRTGAYATVWSVEPTRGNAVKVRLSTSRKDRQTGNYEQDFSGFCSFVSRAAALSMTLHERDRIRLVDVDVTTKYNKETGKEYTNFTVFSYEPVSSGNTDQQQRQEQVVEDNPVDGEEDPAPF